MLVFFQKSNGSAFRETLRGESLDCELLLLLLLSRGHGRHVGSVLEIDAIAPLPAATRPRLLALPLPDNLGQHGFPSKVPDILLLPPAKRHITLLVLQLLNPTPSLLLPIIAHPNTTPLHLLRHSRVRKPLPGPVCSSLHHPVIGSLLLTQRRVAHGSEVLVEVVGEVMRVVIDLTNRPQRHTPKSLMLFLLVVLLILFYLHLL